MSPTVVSSYLNYVKLVKLVKLWTYHAVTPRLFGINYEHFTNMHCSKKDNECGGNRKESTGNEVEVVWTCDEKRRALRRKEGDGNEITGEKDESKS